MDWTHFAIVYLTTAAWFLELVDRAPWVPDDCPWAR